jgi:hypothetical protein
MSLVDHYDFGWYKHEELLWIFGKQDMIGFVYLKNFWLLRG